MVTSGESLRFNVTSTLFTVPGLHFLNCTLTGLATPINVEGGAFFAYNSSKISVTGM